MAREPGHDGRLPAPVLEHLAWRLHEVTWALGEPRRVGLAWVYRVRVRVWVRVRARVRVRVRVRVSARVRVRVGVRVRVRVGVRV